MGVLSVEGTRLLMDGRPFYYQGLSFFNALYNPRFNQSDEERLHWLRHFRSWGITALRIWGDWRVQNGWVDEGPDHSLWVYPGCTYYSNGTVRNRIFQPEGALNSEPLERLQRLLSAADSLQMVVEIALFSHYMVYPQSTRDGYVDLITRELLPWRNCIFEVWNEYDADTLRHYKAIKAIDPARLVTNSPHETGIQEISHTVSPLELGDTEMWRNTGRDIDNRMLDLLAPHTLRKPRNGHFWETAPRQIEMLLVRYNKPVLDDEPARTGIAFHGGIPESNVAQHIAHIDGVRKVGGYHNYHHDMFQSDYGSEVTPPHGIPDPEFSPFHRPIFEHLRDVAPDDVKQN